MRPSRQDPPSIWRALWRGWRRRCPHCAEGPLFESWFGLHRTCRRCDLAIEPKPGDTWAFWLIGDRVFLGLMILAVFVIFRSADWRLAGLVLAATVLPLIWTMPHRLGVCVAIDYLVRRHFGKAEELWRPPESD